MIASYRPGRWWCSALGAGLMLALAATTLTDAKAAAPEAPGVLAAEGEREGLITRIYDIRDLLTPVPNYRPPVAAPIPDGATVFGRFESPPSAAAEAGRKKRLDALVARIRQAAGEEAWQPAGTGRIVGEDGRLVVQQTKANHEKLEKVIASMTEQASVQIVLAARFLTADAELFDGEGVTWEALGPIADATERQPREVDERPPSDKPVGRAEWTVRRPVLARCATLSKEQVAELLKRCETHRNTKVLSAPRLCVFTGRWAYVTAGTETAYVADYKLAADPNAARPYVPQMGNISEGLTLAIRATAGPTSKQVDIETEPSMSKLIHMERAPFRAPDGTRTKLQIDVPTLATMRLSAKARVADGATLALRGLPVGWAEGEPARDGQELLVLIEATKVKPSDVQGANR